MARLLDDRQVLNRAALPAIGSAVNAPLNSIFADINTIFANATFLPTPSVLMTRDANANTQANNFISNLTITATAAGTTTLTVASSYAQQFTGTSTQIVILPNATTLALDQSFYIANRSTGNVTIETNGGATLQVLTANSQAIVRVTNIGTSAGTWDVDYTVSGPVPFLQTQVVTDPTTTGTDATLLANDTAFGTVRLTNGSLISVSGVVAGTSGQYITIENQTGNPITVNNNEATATAANRIFTGTGSNVAMANNSTFSFVYDSTQSRWMLIGGTGSGNGSGTGKNYLSAITTSQSPIPNTGNGNFELGSTTGWSLGTTGTLTNGIPTGSPTFGSGASGNLSISAVSTGQLAGTFSLSYASSAATTAGNCLASDAFFIDTEDQARVLTVSFDYKAQTNPTNANWSGTSSSSFGVAIWDVANSVWIQVNPSFGLIQSSNVGLYTGSFQTSANGTSYRLVVYNANATSGAATVYFDDFVVGPQANSSSSAVVSFSGQNASQAVTANVTDISLTASKDTNAGWNGTQYKVPTAGDYFCSGVVVNTGGVSSLDVYVNGVFVAFGSGSFTSGASSVLSVLLANLNPGDLISFRYGANATLTSSYFGIFQIGGGAVSSSGQVVAASAHLTTGTSTAAGSPINFNVIDFDTSAGITTGASWKYTAPFSGYYAVTSSNNYTTVGPFVTELYHNNVLYRGLNGWSGGVGVNSPGTTILFCNAGDTLFVSPNSTATPSSDATINWITINLLNGSSSTAASTTVAMRYTDTSGQNSGTANPFIFHTKTFDSHNAYNATTGIYTVPVAGKYRVSATITAQSTGSNFFNVYAKLNGSIYGILGATSQAFGNPNVAGGSDTMNCIPGDQISIQSGGTPVAAGTSVGDNHLSIERIGN